MDMDFIERTLQLKDVTSSMLTCHDALTLLERTIQFETDLVTEYYWLPYFVSKEVQGFYDRARWLLSALSSTEFEVIIRSG